MRTHEVSSTTAERNEVKRDAGGLDRAKHGKPEGQNVNEVNVLAISLFRWEKILKTAKKGYKTTPNSPIWYPKF